MNCALANIEKMTLRQLLSRLLVVALSALLIWLSYSRWKMIVDRTKEQQRYDNKLQVGDRVIARFPTRIVSGYVTRKGDGWTTIDGQYSSLDSDFDILTLLRVNGRAQEVS